MDIELRSLIQFCSLYNTQQPLLFSEKSRRRIRSLTKGCGSPVVKVSDHSRHVMSSSPEPLKTRRYGSDVIQPSGVMQSLLLGQLERNDLQRFIWGAENSLRAFEYMDTVSSECLEKD
ncbi:hypothetical protein TNCV_4976421 [Trichonephila clavipes]|nr:hypothetical protein TNCV_4976421 [Trichonephila clavipes]